MAGTTWHLSSSITPYLRCLSTAALCLVLSIGAAERAAANPLYTLEHIGRREGLRQTSVRAVTVDRRGFLWIGTETGVARYDGYRFKAIAAPFGDGVVTSINVDSRNRLWIRWYGRPLTVYDQRDERWRMVAADGSDAYDGFVEDARGVVWVASRTQLLYYDEQSQRLAVAAPLPPGPSSALRQLALLGDTIWATADRSIIGYDIAKRSIIGPLSIPAPAMVRLWVHSGSLWLCTSAEVLRLQGDFIAWRTIYRAARAHLTACELDRDGALWLGVRDAGAIRVEEGSEMRFRRRRDDRTSLADDLVVNVQADRRGQVWVITPGAAHRWLGGPRFERFEYSPDSHESSPGGLAAINFVEDDGGVIWLGSEGWGLAKIAPFARKARLLTPPSSINAHVRKPVVDRNGDVWIGMNRDGVFRWNRATETWTHFQADAAAPAQLPTAQVRALLATRGGDIWAGSDHGGIISKYDAASRGWRRVSLGSDQQIFTLLEHPSGRLIAGRNSQATEYDPQTARARHFASPAGAPLRASILSQSGNVFFGAHHGGVFEFVPERGFTRSWVEELSDSNVFSLYEDRYGKLWIGTWGGGLNRLDPDTGEVQVIATSDGLPNNTIFGILPGRHDDLWVSTYAGLARIERCIVREQPCRPKITVLNVGSGLPFDEFDSEAAELAPDGALLFGGVEGLLWFDPDRIESNPRAPRLQFSDMFLNDRSLAPFWLGAERSEDLELAHDFGALKIDFSALDFAASAHNRYRYRLSPSRQWLSLGAHPTVTLSNLGSGRRTLEISGANNDGVWSDAPLSLSIRVRPPWYTTIHAWLAYAALLAVAVALAVRWRERRLRASNLRLEAVVAERTHELAATTAARDEFYANVSHEIRTPLTLLVGAVQTLQEERDRRCIDQTSADLLRYSDSLRRYVDSLITVSHLRSAPAVSWLQEDVASFIRSAVADYQRIADGIALVLEGAVERPFVRSYPNALDAIFCNLLSNAIRHTPRGGTVRITMTEEDERISVEIADTGPGIDSRLMTSLFERGPRGERISSTTIGYGIGLSLVKQTALALGGGVTAGNRRDGGACFTVTLPRADPGLPVASYERAPIAEFGVTSREPVSAPRAGGGPRSRGSILIIEDHDELRSQLARLFATMYRVSEAACAADGLAQARRRLPDVVICDVMLPDGDGFAMAAALKSDMLTEHISVILLTALADEPSRIRGLAAEADLYVTKPFLREELKLQVANLLNQRQRIRRSAARERWAAKEAAAADMAPGNKKAGFEERVLSTLDALYSDPGCTVDVLAQRFAMSRKQLERKIRYCFACSPKALLNRYRLDKAAELLDRGLPVAEAADRCGFGSQSHFGVMFKKRFGRAPSRRPLTNEASS